MSQFLQDDDKDDAKAIAIRQVFYAEHNMVSNTIQSINKYVQSNSFLGTPPTLSDKLLYHRTRSVD